MIFFCITLSVLATGGLADGAETKTATLDAEIYDLNSIKGQVGCLLFDKADGFPSKSKQAKAQIWAKIDGKLARCKFEGLKPGWYAVAVLHDENQNAKMDTNMLGIPKEGYGASNDAKGTIGPPSFADAKVKADGGTQKLRIRMNY